MSVKLLLSEPAGGKTACCLRRIREVRAKDPLAPVKVIVPDKMQMAYWKQLLAADGSIGTEVLSFGMLSLNLLECSDSAPRLISSYMDSICVREAITRAASVAPLEYFAPIIDKPGLPAVLGETIRALQHGCITPEELAEAGQNDPKTTDTAQIFRAYLDLLREHDRVGSAGLPNAAVEALKAGRTEFPRCPLLITDGFDVLTEDCLQLLLTISGSCDEILITLPGGTSDSPTDLRIRAHARSICEKLGAEPVTVPRAAKSPILQTADRVFDSRPGADPGPAFMMIEASSQTTEVREALRELKKRIISGAVRPRDCAVFVPDMHAYMPLIRQFGREMGIPLYSSEKRSFSGTPAASALIRLLQLYPDFKSTEVLSVLRLPFFSGCPDPADGPGKSFGDDLCILGQIVGKMNIIGGTDDWKSGFEKAAAEAGKNRDTEDEDRVFDFPEPVKILRMRDSFLRLTTILTPPDGIRSRAEWISWLGDLLKTLRFFEKIDPEVGAPFERGLDSLFTRMISCEEELRRPALLWEAFLAELKDDLNNLVYSDREVGADRVFVGSISQTSGCRWKLVVLTGFAEGVFPRPENEELILTEALRNKLHLTEKDDQQLLFRHALTRSDGGLILTRPQKTDKGEEWPASIFWNDILKVLKADDSLIRIFEYSPVVPASMEELAFRQTRTGAAVPAGLPADTAAALSGLLDEAQRAAEISRLQSEGVYTPDPDPALSGPADLEQPFSCSAIENWLTCPFRYLLSRKFSLEKPQEPGAGPDAAQLGTLNHKVMEKTFPPGTVYASGEEALKKAESVIDDVLRTASEEIGFRESELWAYEKEQLRQKLLDSIEKMFAAPQMPMTGNWKCVGAELKFGYPKNGTEESEPLIVETNSGTIRIRGIIDRVDVRNDGLYRVIDYKTGSSGFTSKELQAGSHIQAGVYAAAVVHALRMGTKCEGMYWGINNRKLQEYLSYDSEKDENIPKIDFLNRFAEGIRDAVFPAQPAGDSCPDYCPAAGWCRKYGRRVKHG